MYVDWGTGIIYVYKTDLTLVQATPTEIYDLNLNWFRLRLKDLEDDEAGISYPRTHNHNGEVTLSGLTFARVIEILEPYTVTFEDGQYAVNLTGANSNVGDRVNVNQVSVRSQNSAGMTSSPDIEYASFQNAVTIDVVNGVSGTIYPAGTKRQPVNNITDAMVIAVYRGLKSLFLNSDLEISEAVDLSGFVIEGNNHVNTELKIGAAANINNLKIINCTIYETTLDGDVDIANCVVRDVSYMNGHIHDCGLMGTIALAGNRESVIAGCFTVDQDYPPIIDMGGSGNDLSMPHYSGIVTIRNLTSATEEVGIGLASGLVILDSTITAGTVIIAGNGVVTDNSTGASVDISGLVNIPAIMQAVWTYTGA